MDQLSLEIQEAISKNLPESVGSILKKRLEQAESDARSLKAAMAARDDLAKRLEEAKALLQEKDAKYNDVLSREAELAKKEKEVAKREADVDKAAAVHNAISLSQLSRIQDLKEVVSLVFQSKYRHTERVDRQIPVPSSAAGYAPTIINQTETKTVEGQGPA